MVVIAGCGGYVPLYRIDREAIAEQHGGRGSGESAVPGRDENHVTMAVEAAELAVERAAVDELDAVVSASITDPFAEHGIAAHVAYRLGATGEVRTADFRASGRAGTDALAFARDFVRARDGTVLVVAADVLPVEPGHDDEPYAGAGAGAAVLAPDAEEPAATITAVGEATTGFVERHRLHDGVATGGDGRFEREAGFGPAVSAAIERSGVDDPDRAVVAAHDARMASGAVEDASHESTFGSVGYAGAASYYLDLAHCLEEADAGESVVAVAYGPGGADAVALETGTTADVGLTVAEQLDSKEYVTYAKHLEYRERTEYTGVTVA